MNIQNIATLASQLKTIGFDNMGHSLMKRICFIPDNFSIIQKMMKVPENVSFNFFFEKELNTEVYKLCYYDAVLHKEAVFSETSIAGLSVKSIDENMTQVDWKTAFNFSIVKPFAADDKASYETEVRIFQVVNDLNKLTANEEGKAISIALKQKYWSEIPYLDIMGIMTNGRIKSDISQRFYFSEGQPVISADEAYRFLLNRWMEKEMQLKKKHHETENNFETENASSSPGSGLLKKKRFSSNRSGKRNKSSQD